MGSHAGRLAPIDCLSDRDGADLPYRNVTVLPPGPHRFDGDGIGCEQ